MDETGNDLPGLETMDEIQAMAEIFGTSEEVVTRYSKCNLCGSNLHFSHVTDFSRNITQETAKCPECGVRVRKVMHKLQ